jgi:small subunit ribosomal protein S28e
MAVPAKVVQVLGRNGHRGIQKIRCKVTEGSQEGKILVRNIMGPVREDDVLMLRETQME